jgi:hypothetical protein
MPFEVLMDVKVTLCSAADRYQHFGGNIRRAVPDYMVSYPRTFSLKATCLHPSTTFPILYTYVLILLLPPWRWRQQILWCWYLSIKLHSIVSNKHKFSQFSVQISLLWEETYSGSEKGQFYAFLTQFHISLKNSIGSLERSIVSNCSVSCLWQ